MTAEELKILYLDYFKNLGHQPVSGASLIPENDPTVLFTTAGMHPLVPHLLGEPHPAGRRLCNCQRCVRTGDIESVGDASHLTFFEMLGNWSLGDYFKKEAIEWSFEFLTSSRYLGFEPERLFVTVFAGTQGIPADEESRLVWRRLGVKDSHIFTLGMEDNWWGPAGQTGPCGPDTEMFIDTGAAACGPNCRPGCACGKFHEIWNDVMMEYEKTAGGEFVPLRQRNVDTGMGVERTIALLQGKKTVYATDLFTPVFERIVELRGGRGAESDRDTRAFRVISDHIRASVFIIGDRQGATPGNLGRGYVLRRLIRRAVRYAKQLGMAPGFTAPLADAVIERYRGAYPELDENRARIESELTAEENRFEKTLDQGLRELDKVLEQIKAHGQSNMAGRIAFRLYDTYGFPLEFSEEICAEQGVSIDRDGFDKAFSKHQEISRAGADKAFKGGLADQSQVVTRLHTATHLLHRSLRLVLGEHVKQKGSNITAERLRFDFSHPAKLTPEEISSVEAMVNETIQRRLPVTSEDMTLEEAKSRGAMALFDAKYGERVKVYSAGDFSMEVCGGPHAANTSELGKFRIIKEEASSAGVRRIRAVLE